MGMIFLKLIFYFELSLQKKRYFFANSELFLSSIYKK